MHFELMIGGRFRLLYVTDPDNLSQRRVVLETMSKADFELYHIDRQVRVGKKWLNPASTFVERAKRLSVIEFAPPPVEVHANTFNLYRDREISPREGSCEHLKYFIEHTVCSGREDLFQFVWHLRLIGIRQRMVTSKA